MTNSWKAEGNEFGGHVIRYAVRHSKLVSSEEDSQGRFVREFLVLFRFALGYGGVKNRTGKLVLAGIDEEFDRFDREWRDVRLVQMRRYRKALDRAPSGSDLIECLVGDMTRWIDEPTDLFSWDSLVESLNFLMDLFCASGPDSASLGTVRESTRTTSPPTFVRRCRGRQHVVSEGTAG